MKILAIYLVLAHFFGDWLLQSRKMAQNKSQDLWTLLCHLMVVTAIIAYALALFMGRRFLAHTDAFIYLLTLNAVSHGLIDWFIPRIYLWIRGDCAYERGAFWQPVGGEGRQVKHDYYFFTTIALDQILHLTILFALFLP